MFISLLLWIKIQPQRCRFNVRFQAGHNYTLAITPNGFPIARPSPVGYMFYCCFLLFSDSFQTNRLNIYATGLIFDKFAGFDMQMNNQS